MFYAYILTNKNHTVFYTGYTDDVYRRAGEHKEKIYGGFTKRYNVSKLVYYETFSTAEEAKHREAQIKRYKREWKTNLINSMNPHWRDLYEEFME